MAYENGKRINRYAAMKHHKNELKRRHTPLEYSSYEKYVVEKRRQDQEFLEMFALRYPQVTPYLTRQEKRAQNGGKEYYERYWEAYTGYIGPGWKKNLKESAHSKERAFYRQEIAKIKQDATYEVSRFKKFDDPWHWD